MEKQKVYTALGLMSGTSFDGIDAAIIRTDGYGFAESVESHTERYPDEIRSKLRQCMGKRDRDNPLVKEIEHLITLEHVKTVEKLIAKAQIDSKDIDFIGFHGQTIAHDPQNRFTLQIGDGNLLAAETGISVINDMRSADVKAGGEGAPLLPLYHRCLVLASGLELPVVILNLGGVGNVTYIGQAFDNIYAFDTGPANALIDDFVFEKTGMSYDTDGKLAKNGQANLDLISQWLQNDYFERQPPKSLDRDDWDFEILPSLSIEDSVATLANFTIETVFKSVEHLPTKPSKWLVTGGGRHNQYIMDGLSDKLQASVVSVDTLQWNGDTIEAEGFAYLAVRSYLGEPLSLPTTTGVPKPMSGGVLHTPRTKNAA